MNEPEDKEIRDPKLALLDFLSNMDMAEEHPESFYHQLLETVITLIPRAEYGTVSLISNDEWKFVAAVGHRLDLLLNLDLKAEWDLSGHDIIELNSIEERHQDQFPPDIQKIFEKATKKTSASLLGAYYLPDGDKVVLSVDIPKRRKPFFPEESKKVFQALLNLAGKQLRLISDEKKLRLAYQELQERTNGIELSYQEISRLSDKLRNLLNLAWDLGQGVVAETNNFFDKLLDAARNGVDQARCGSISMIEKGRWHFMSAYGHDAKFLRSLNLSSKWIPNYHQTVSIRNVLADFQKSMPAEFFLQVQKAWNGSPQSLVGWSEVEKDVYLLVTLELDLGLNEKLPHSSLLIFESFVRLAHSFLRQRVHTETIKQAYLRFSEKLALLAEAHDADTAIHNKRVSLLSGYLAREFGLDKKLAEDIETFAILHDIGKIFLDSNLLKQNDTLDPQEYEIVKTHTLLAGKLLDDPFFATAQKIALYHHERWDGSGYPYGLKGNEIPIEAQIVSLADVYDALRSKRSYKDAYPPDKVIKILREGDGRIHAGMFNPEHLVMLEARIDEIERLIYWDVP